LIQIRSQHFGLVDALKHGRWQVHFNGYFRRHFSLAVFLDGSPHVLNVGSQLQVSGARNLWCRRLNRDLCSALEHRNRLIEDVSFHSGQKCHVKTSEIL
jgi:hypothetical protein